MTTTAWAPAGPAKYGQIIDGPANRGSTGLTAVPSPGESGSREIKLLSPENPLLAWAALAGLTFGLMAFSTSVRVGKTTASVSVGSTK